MYFHWIHPLQAIEINYFCFYRVQLKNDARQLHLYACLYVCADWVSLFFHFTLNSLYNLSINIYRLNPSKALFSTNSYEIRERRRLRLSV